MFAPEFFPIFVRVVNRLAVGEGTATPVARGQEGEDAEIIFFAREVGLVAREAAVVAVPFYIER